MIESFVQSWEKHKDELKEFIKTHPQSEYGESYMDLVKLLFDKVINPDIPYNMDKYTTKHIHEIDDNSYHGTLLFILYKTTYPSIYDYVYTSVEYGSCSVCDTLQGIQGHMMDLPDGNQVDGYMQLLLNLLQNCHLMKGEE